MKVITQILPNEDEIVTNNLKIKNYILDRDTYLYFLILFEKEFGEYVFKKTGTKSIERLTFEEQRNIEPKEAFKRGRDLDAWWTIAKKHFKKFNEQRPKFYLYNGKIYSYTYMGRMNIGQIVEVWEYDNEDLIQVLNFKKRRRIF